MKILYLIAAMSIAVASARANEKKQLTLGEAADLFASLQLLDGYRDICRDGGAERECQKHYRLAPGAMTSIALDIARLRPIANTFSDARNSLIRQFGGVVGEKDRAAFLIEESKLRNTPADMVEFAPLTMSDLNIDVNPYPPSVLAAILPALQER